MERWLVPPHVGLGEAGTQAARRRSRGSWTRRAEGSLTGQRQGLPVEISQHTREQKQPPPLRANRRGPFLPDAGAMSGGTPFRKDVIRAHPFNLQFPFSRILAQERNLSSRESLLHKCISLSSLCTSEILERISMLNPGTAE